MASALEKAIDRTNAYIARLQGRVKLLQARLDRKTVRSAVKSKAAKTQHEEVAPSA